MHAILLLLVSAAPATAGYDAPLPELKWPLKVSLAAGVPADTLSVDAAEALPRFFQRLEAPEFSSLKSAVKRREQLRFAWAGTLKLGGAPFALAYVQTGPTVDALTPETWLIALGARREPLGGVLLAANSRHEVVESVCDAAGVCTRVTSDFDVSDHHRERWNSEVFTISGFREGAVQLRGATHTVRDYFDPVSRAVLTLITNDLRVDCLWRTSPGSAVVLGRVDGDAKATTLGVELEDQRRLSLTLAKDRRSLDATLAGKTARFIAVGFDTAPQLKLPLTVTPGPQPTPALAPEDVRARLGDWVREEELDFTSVSLQGEFVFQGTRYVLLQRFTSTAYEGTDAALAALSDAGVATRFLQLGEAVTGLDTSSTATITADGRITVTTDQEFRDQERGALRGLRRTVRTSALVPGGFAEVETQDRHRTYFVDPGSKETLTFEYGPDDRLAYYSPKPEAPIVRLEVDGDQRTRRFAVRFKKAGKPYRVVISDDEKTLECTPPDGAVQRFERAKDPWLRSLERQ